MEKLFERHDEYVSTVPMEYVRSMMDKIDWSLRLIAIKGPKGVGKSTLMLQYIRRNFAPDDRHVLYCSADTSYFSNHTLVDVADNFCKQGGTHLFIDEIHKYENWSGEIKEIYDLHRNLHIVVSGSSLLRINDGQSDLSRRIKEYAMPGLSFREYLWFEHGLKIDSLSLEELLAAPNAYCQYVKSVCHPLEFFPQYLRVGYYPFYYEGKKVYQSKIESVVNYIIDAELTGYRNVEVGNVRKIKALLQVLSQIVPYEIDIAKLSKSIGIQRTTTLKYLTNLEEAALIRRLFAGLDRIIISGCIRNRAGLCRNAFRFRFRFYTGDDLGAASVSALCGDCGRKHKCEQADRDEKETQALGYAIFHTVACSAVTVRPRSR